MKYLATLVLSALIGTQVLFAIPTPNWKASFTFGDPQIESIHAMAFGPEGILFLGDAQAAAVIAIETEMTEGEAAESINMSNIDQAIAAMLGVEATEITVQDMAVHPLSKAIYLAVHTPDDRPLLLKTDGNTFEALDLEAIAYSKVELTAPVAIDAEDRRGRSLRKWAISDLAFYQNQVMVSGLSNEEFSSTFRSIPFPFTETQHHSSLEIYHAAHGRYETYAPIKTFMPYQLKGKDYLIASYTCTPLVLFPLAELEPGTHTKGQTVAELGNRNTPLDIISYTQNGKEYLLLANTSRALMKIDPEQVADYQDYLTEPVEGNSATAGVSFLSMPYVNVQQLADYSEEAVVMIQRKANGDLDLMTVSKRRL